MGHMSVKHERAPHGLCVIVCDPCDPKFGSQGSGLGFSFLRKSFYVFFV